MPLRVLPATFIPALMTGTVSDQFQPPCFDAQTLISVAAKSTLNGWILCCANPAAPNQLQRGLRARMLTAANQEPAHFGVSLLGGKVQAIHIIPGRHIGIRTQLKQHFHVVRLHTVGKAASWIKR